jgi:hypothetical protein
VEGEGWEERYDRREKRRERRRRVADGSSGVAECEGGMIRDAKKGGEGDDGNSWPFPFMRDGQETMIETRSRLPRECRELRAWRSEKEAKHETKQGRDKRGHGDSTQEYIENLVDAN